MTFADAKQRFSSRVADYLRYRPGYPSEVLPLRRAECGLKPGHVVADIGSGTGFLSELFLKNGNRVYGVEPNEAMREAGEEYLASYDNFSSIVGSAEATTLESGSVDFVSAGQAFHWFEPNATRAEFRRILKANGWIVVLWNDRQTGTPFVEAYENLLVKYGTDYKRVREAYPEAQVMQEFLGAVTVSQKILPNEQVLDWEGHANYAPMLEDLEQLFRANEKDGYVRTRYATHVFCGRLANQG